jgi:hypothetical protein
MKEQLAAGLGEREIAEFVEHDEVKPGQIIGEPALSAGARFAFQAIDEIDDSVKAAASAAADAGPRDGYGEMRFAGAGRDRDMVPDIRGRKRRFTIPFILASAAELRSLGAIRSGMSPCWWSNSLTGR